MPHAWDSNWNVGERLGKGAQGVTHSAISRTNPALKAALKYLLNNKSSQARRRMAKEVINLQTLHDLGGSVPRVLDHNTTRYEDDRVELYLAMEFIPGPTINERVMDLKRFEIDDALKLTLALCRTIRIAHDSNILHRDLKPDNIILREGKLESPVIVDYGLSFNASDDQNITQTDETFQNRFLSAPETTTPGGNRRDRRTDITAICGILFYCMSSRYPVQLRDSDGLAPHRRPSCVLTGTHGNDPRIPALDAFFTKAFALNIQNRYQGVDEVESSLQALLTTNSPIDESSPRDVAASFSRLLRQHDRVTQLAEFKMHAQKLFGFLESQINGENGQLQRFTVQNVNGGFQPKTSLPDGLDLVLPSVLTVHLTATHHPYHRCRKYCVASRGEECVLMAVEFDYEDNQSRGVGDMVLECAEVVRFTGDPDEVLDLAATDQRQWIVRQLRELAKLIGLPLK